MPGIFDKTVFNPEAFTTYMNVLEAKRTNELIKSSAIRVRPDLKTVMANQVAGNIVTVPIAGLIDGKADNYDGNTDITTDSTNTYSQQRIVIGRAHSWTEKDFVFDITGGYDPIYQVVATQLLDWWADVKQDDLLAILEGVFKMTGTENAKFVKEHTYEEDVFNETTLNNALQQAFGEKKSKFAAAFMHSSVATGLENLQLLGYAKYTDANGIQRDMQLGLINGRPVIIDDSLPVGSDGKYTTYVLGEGAIEYTPVGAKVPNEVDRDPRINGGQDSLYTRDRYCYAPYGISFTGKNLASLSPTNAELKLGANWEVVKDGENKPMPFNQIPIARIVTSLEAPAEEEPNTGA